MFLSAPPDLPSSPPMISTSKLTWWQHGHLLPPDLSLLWGAQGSVQVVRSQGSSKGRVPTSCPPQTPQREGKECFFRFFAVFDVFHVILLHVFMPSNDSRPFQNPIWCLGLAIAGRDAGVFRFLHPDHARAS